MPNDTLKLLLGSGGFALGVAIACLVAFFLNRFNIFNAKVLGSVVSIIAGGVVTAFLGLGKEYAWVGYCCGLGVLLFFFVVSGHLRVSPDEAYGGKDMRLKMLDELSKRHSSHDINWDDYKAMKEAILAEIRKNPAISEAVENKTVNPK